ncbi:hypothetical protein Dimus_020154 [Dionaea muscipula]
MSCTVAVSKFSPPLPSVSSSPSLPSSCSGNSPSSPSSFGFRCLWAADDDSNGIGLKRKKRPAMLDIPILPLGFPVPPGFTSRSPEASSAVVVEAETTGFYSVCCKRGRRPAMEDRYSAVLHIHGDPKQAFFGVFDGHGGAKAAEFAAENMNKNIMDQVASRDVEDAVRLGYLKTDSDFLKEEMYGGSCCVTALIRDGNLVVSNAGDCRAVMSRGGLAEPLTADHRPSREDEKDRIQAMGGYIDCYHGVWRIEGSLAVSRGIGDQHLKQWVISEPETRVHRIEPDYEFLILASDGLWDKVSNQEAVDVARPLCTGTSKPEPLAACKKLIDISVSRGSCDDISVMLIQLQPYRL